MTTRSPLPGTLTRLMSSSLSLWEESCIELYSFESFQTSLGLVLASECVDCLLLTDNRVIVIYRQHRHLGAMLG